MHNNIKITRKTASDLVPGELFIASLDGVNSSLMMRLFEANGRALYGILQSDLFSSPLSWYSGEVNGACLTFGTEWFLETLLGSETHSASTFQRNPNHRLFLDKDESVVWRFVSDVGGFRRPLDYVIGEPAERQIDSTASPFETFSLWADRADYLDQRASPVFTYSPSK